MKEIDISVPPPEPADAIAHRISSAAELTGYKVSQPDERILRLDRVDTPYWLSGLLAHSRAVASLCSSPLSPTASPHAATAPAR